MPVKSRVMKLSFLKNEDLAEQEPLARLLLQGLWFLADRDGRLEDRPKRIKAEVLPYDSCNVDELLSNLNGTFIQRYEVAGKRYIQVLNWHNASVYKNEPSLNIPEPLSNPSRTVPEGFPKSSLVEEEVVLEEEVVKKGGVGGNNPQRKLAPVPAPKLVFPPSLDTERCRSAWERWLTHKRRIKKPYKSVDSQNTMLKRWAVFGAERFIDAIDHSIGSGYTGIFEDPKRGKSRGESAHERNMEKLRQAELEAMQNG